MDYFFANTANVLANVAVVVAMFLIIRDIVFIVPQQEVAIVERLGKFARVAGPGLALKIPLIERIAGRTSLRVTEAAAKEEVRSKDELFLHMTGRLQYMVGAAKVYESFYQLNEAEAQIRSYFRNALRSVASHFTVDELFSDREAVAKEVREMMASTIERYGFEIVDVLVDSPEPSPEVRRAFDRVASAKRERDAAKMEGEALKVKVVADAEAQAERRRLQGEGTAKQREEIAKGFALAIKTMRGETGDALSDETLISILMLSNHFDTIREASNNKGTVILLPAGGTSGMDELGRMIAAIHSSSASNVAGEGAHLIPGKPAEETDRPIAGEHRGE